MKPWHKHWSLVVHGEPVGKARARVVRDRSGRVRAYTPKKSANWERSAAILARRVMQGEEPTRKPVQLRLVAVMPVPESWPKWKREAATDGRIMPTGKPDLDNIIKAAKDALNGIIWRDDSQVVEVKALQIYGSSAMVSIGVSELGQYPASVARRSELQEICA